MLIESPYFMLGERPIDVVRQLTARGVKVRILTNSAASNDVMLAHAGYANTRKDAAQGGSRAVRAAAGQQYETGVVTAGGQI